MNEAPAYFIWGVDWTVYGPIELITLVSWIKDERVVADTWIFSETEGAWRKAAQMPELKMFFKKTGKASSDREIQKAGIKIKAGALRRIKIFSGFEDEQLEKFLQFMEVISVPPFRQVVVRGAVGDAMYFVLEGELRSSLTIDGKETTLSTLLPGHVFGEISLLDHGPHAADVISNVESVLLRFSGEAFEKVLREAPQLALPFLLALSEAVAGRVRVLTKRFEDSLHVSQGARLLQAAA
ncbi:MAG: cyclic nucleotide-binding domain-containing protein [Verrucomicrobiota bacterium]|jgi:CRP-like cAMP-binding protein